MSDLRGGDITLLLNKLENQEDEALEALVAFVYAELRRIASGLVKGEAAGHTLRATDVVHEAYFRLFDSDSLAWDNRRHFFASAAIAMRRVLIDHARKKKAGKRIPKDEQIPIDLIGGALELHDNVQPTSVDILALDQALQQLAKVDERQARIVELRYFAGLTTEELAELFELSAGSINREWRIARLWLRREMRRRTDAPT